MNDDNNMCEQSDPMNETAIDDIAPAGPFLTVSAGISVALSGLGSRWDWWHFTVGFVILRWSAVVGFLATIVSLTGAIPSGWKIRRAGVAIVVAGQLVQSVVAGVPWWWMCTAQQLPRINDITTDMNDPPSFISILPLRNDTPNSPAYGGRKTAVQQLAAYPDIMPLVLHVSTDSAFALAHNTARAMAWTVVDENVHDDRIEAMDRTFWFGFTDDIVVRITPLPGGSRIDVRSASREGLSDIGTNAKRIWEFLRKLSESVRPEGTSRDGTLYCTETHQ
jgi:uncharacterized protein (DUF1499 family)